MSINKYQISCYGFLPEKCHDKLPDRFKCFQKVLDNLSVKQSNGQEFRNYVNELPKFDSKAHNWDRTLDIGGCYDRDQLDTYNDEQCDYDRYGINFDRTFGFKCKQIPVDDNSI